MGNQEVQKRMIEEKYGRSGRDERRRREEEGGWKNILKIKGKKESKQREKQSWGARDKKKKTGWDR